MEALSRWVGGVGPRNVIRVTADDGSAMIQSDFDLKILSFRENELVVETEHPTRAKVFSDGIVVTLKESTPEFWLWPARKLITFLGTSAVACVACVYVLCRTLAWLALVWK